jgi:SHS family lactate transporter-like MFS transporter
MAIAALSGWTSEQKHVVAASFLGWSLDAFDFFLLVFVLKDIAAEFHTDIPTVSYAILLTLAMRPVGAFIFGRAADRWGRRPTLMVDIVLYSVLEFASGFAPNLTVLIVLRALYGIAMGGEWGVGASLTMETIPPHARGFVSGLLQSGYPAGYFMASIVYGVLFPYIGWRGMFMVGVIPALLVFYIRRTVPESPSWSKQAAVERGSTLAVLKSHWRLAIYAVVLMTAFNFFSHGTQDIYPTFLQEQHKLTPHVVSIIAVIYNIGAICGGILFGSLSERFGRRRCIIIAALLSLPAIPLWAFADSAVVLAIGAFLIQFTVQGAWGIVPVQLNELSPSTARGTARQSSGVGQRDIADHPRRTFRRQLRPGAGDRRRNGCDHHRGADRRRHRGQRGCFRRGGSREGMRLIPPFGERLGVGSPSTALVATHPRPLPARGRGEEIRGVSLR